MLAASDAFTQINILTILQQYFKGSSFAGFLQQWEPIIFSVAVALIIVFVFRIGSKRREMLPKGLQNALELYVESIRLLTNTVIGPKGEPYIPFLGSLFIYILALNLFGLLPLMKSPSSNLNVTIALAVCVFVLVQYLNIRNMGIMGFVYHMAGSPKDLAGWIMAPLLFPIEIIVQLSRPLTLAFRLFGNIFGEKILVAYFAMLGISLLPFLQPLSLPLQVPFLLFGLFTGILQAIVFTLLTTVYILLSIPDEEH